MNVYLMLDLVRSLLARQSTSGTSPARIGFIDDVEILRFINMEQDNLVKIIQGYKNGLLVHNVAISTDSNGEYSMPVYTQGRPLHIKRLDQSYDLRIAPCHFGETWFYDADLSVAGKEKYTYEHGKIYFSPSQVSKSGAWRMWYNWKVPWLLTGIATAGSATTITLASNAWVDRRDDYYNNIDMELVSGTGSGEGSSTISDYAGSTRVATWHKSTNPDDTSIYAMISPIPEKYHMLLVYKAAILGRAKAREKAEDLWDIYNRELSTFHMDMSLDGDIYNRHTEEDYDDIMMGA